MFKPSNDWNPKQSKLREIIYKSECFKESIDICFNLHAFVHQSVVSNSVNKTLADKICENLRLVDYYTMPNIKDATIAWHLWHITRIEDITMNLLVGDKKQILDNTWLKNLNTSITDTGNAMTEKEIAAFSKDIDSIKLLEYRQAVGLRSREVLGSLKFEDMKRKFPKEKVEQLVDQKCLTEHPDSLWLKDFWGKKDVAGILLLPLTRHQASHLNSCVRLKSKIKSE